MDRVIRLTQDLIKINSENPGGDESRIARYVYKFLRKYDYNARCLEFAPKRTNVVCRIRSRHSRKKLLLSPHLDTVPAGGGWKVGPFSGRMIKNRIYGRGASDCKGNLAVALSVLAQFKEQATVLDSLDVIFAATADEETGSDLGFKPVLKKILPFDYALVLDGSGFEITYAQKGLLHLRMSFLGKKAHGAYLERGRNAIGYAMKAFERIKEWAQKLNSRDKDARLTLNIGKIEGGQKVNIVADRCTMDLDFRFAMEKDVGYFLKNIKRLSRTVCKGFSLDVLAFQKPAQTDPGSILIKTLKASLKSRKMSPRLQVCKGATVLNFLTDKDIPCVVFGFSSKAQAHTTDEYIETRNLTKGVALLSDFLARFDKVIASHA